MNPERRHEGLRDRRAVPRGGRRPYDRPGRFPNLLIADSYDGARIPCARYLDHFGFKIEEAKEGTRLLELIQTSSPHVILVEWALPALSARGVSEWFDRQPHARAVPMIVMASDFESERVEQMPPRAMSVLTKPFPLSTLLLEIRRALRSHPPVVS